MPVPPEHAALIGKNRFTPACNQPPGWPDEDWALLRKYGLWYQALAAGTIEPVTEAQRRFAEFFAGTADREPEPPHESLWQAYLKRVEYALQPAEVFGRAPRLPRLKASGEPRLENGDDNAQYFSKRKRR